MPKDLVTIFRQLKGLTDDKDAQDGYERVASEIENLRQQRDEFQKDAERYRYLRSIAVYEGSSDWTIEVWGRFASIEEAIDAAIAKCKEEMK